MPRLLIGLVCLLAGTAVAAQTSPSADELAARIQAHYDSVRDFTADFALVQTNALRPRPRTEEGQVVIKKPLKMRWDYTTSDQKSFVSDGTMLYVTFPEDRYVDVSALPEEENTSTALLFLAGRGDLTRDFVVRKADTQPPGEWHLVLEPVSGREADFETLELRVARNTLVLTGMVVHDGQGGTSTYRFTDLAEDQGVSDRTFDFTIPDGFETVWRR